MIGCVGPQPLLIDQFTQLKASDLQDDLERSSEASWKLYGLCVAVVTSWEYRLSCTVTL